MVKRAWLFTKAHFGQDGSLGRYTPFCVTTDFETSEKISVWATKQRKDHGYSVVREIIGCYEDFEEFLTDMVGTPRDRALAKLSEDDKKELGIVE